jgi:hypothetical protein
MIWGFWEIHKLCGLKSCTYLLQPTFVLQIFKILWLFKILGWPTKRFGTFSDRKLLAASKNEHGLHASKSTMTAESKKGKKFMKILKFSQFVSLDDLG